MSQAVAVSLAVLVYLAVGLVAGIPVGRKSWELLENYRRGKRNSKLWLWLLFPVSAMSGGKEMLSPGKSLVDDVGSVTTEQAYVTLQIFVWLPRLAWQLFVWAVGGVMFCGERILVFCAGFVSPKQRPTRITVSVTRELPLVYSVHLETAAVAKRLRLKFPSPPQEIEDGDPGLRVFLMNTEADSLENGSALAVPCNRPEHIQMRRALWNLIRGFERDAGASANGSAVRGPAEYPPEHLFWRILQGDIPNAA